MLEKLQFSLISPFEPFSIIHFQGVIASGFRRDSVLCLEC